MTDQKPAIFGMKPAQEPQRDVAAEAAEAARALWEPQQQPDIFSRANAGEKLNIHDNGEGSPEAPHAEFREVLRSWGGPIKPASWYDRGDIPLEHIQDAIAPNRERER